MPEPTVEDRVFGAFCETMTVPLNEAVELRSKRLCEDLHLTRIQLHDLFGAVETEFTIEVPLGDRSELKTLDDIVAYVKTCLADLPVGQTGEDEEGDLVLA